LKELHKPIIIRIGELHKPIVMGIGPIWIRYKGDLKKEDAHYMFWIMLHD
jgi:hypothetical protein